MCVCCAPPLHATRAHTRKRMRTHIRAPARPFGCTRVRMHAHGNCSKPLHMNWSAARHEPQDRRRWQT
eukprot:11075074-Alexandrium_andersonii.AAC.1